MSFKIWQIYAGIILIFSFNTSQVACANVESNNSHQREWLVADLATDLNDTNINIDFDTPDKKQWLTSFSRLQNFIEIKNFKEALPLAEETIRFAEKTKDNTLILISHSSALEVYQKLGQIEQVIKSYNSAIASAKLIKKPKVIRLLEISLLIGVAQLYNQQNEPKLALEALNSASKLLDKIDKNLANSFKPMFKTELLINMGWAYNNAQDFSRALQLTEEALQSLPESERAYESITSYYAAQIIPHQFQFRDYQKMLTLWQMGIAYEKLGQSEKSCSLFKDVLSLVKQSSDSHDLIQLIKKSIDGLSAKCQK